MSESNQNMRIVLNEYILAILAAGGGLGYFYSTLDNPTREAVENMAYGALWILGVCIGIMLLAALVEITELDW